MPIEVVVPRSGWSMEEGIFAGWIKADGEMVKPGDRLFALESDKAVEEAESMDAGVLRIPAGAPKKGDVVKVGQVLGYLLAAGESLPGPAPAAPAAAELAGNTTPAAAELGVDIGGDVPVTRSPPKTIPESSPTGEGQLLTGEKATEGTQSRELTSGLLPKAITPRARRAAGQWGVDLTGMIGTGRDGRVRESDVLNVAGAKALSDSAPPLVPAQLERTPTGVTELPVSSLRRTIAERMRRSQTETAAVTLTSRADATNLVGLRNQFKAAAGEGSAPVPAFTDLVAKLVAMALQRHPLLGGRRENDRIVLPSAMHIGIAVDTEAGLLVPVIRDVLNLSLAELSRRSRALIGAAQTRRIKAEDLQGGIFTLTNLGSFGIDAFTPIINFPETAILGLGAIRREAIVLPDGHFGSREAITLSLTFDHRVVDGAPAARFVQTLVQGLENPAAWLLA